MSQTWFTGPIARAIAANNNQIGVNIGFEFGFIFTSITYPLFGLIELYFGKKEFLPLFKRDHVLLGNICTIDKISTTAFISSFSIRFSLNDFQKDGSLIIEC
jgi:hypothetical protein